jgi:hypothetical protein
VSIPGISVSAVNTNTIRTHLVRILHLHYKTACFPWKHEGSGTTLATHSTTHQGPRQRTRRRSTCRHGHAWIGTESQSNWPNMRKTLGKPGFLSGEDRMRTIAKYYRNSQVLPLGGADSGAVVVTPEDFTSSTSVLMDSDLTAIIEAWPTLDTSVRESILEMICRCS